MIQLSRSDQCPESGRQEVFRGEEYLHHMSPQLDYGISKPNEFHFFNSSICFLPGQQNVHLTLIPSPNLQVASIHSTVGKIGSILSVE